MKTTLHVVHPYVYFLKENSFHVAGEASHPKEAEKAGILIKTALANNQSVVRHKLVTGDFINDVMMDVPLRFNKDLGVLLDERVKTVRTSKLGVALPEERPAGVGKKEWLNIKKVLDTRSTMKTLVGESTHSIYFGGMYDACLANALIDHQRYFRMPKERVYCIRELCPDTGNVDALREAQHKLATQVDFAYATFEEALDLLT